MNVRVSAAISFAALLTAASLPANAIVVDPFSQPGVGGTINGGHNISIGAEGSVFELDTFLGIAGQDLNGGFFGSTAQFAFDPLPAGLDLTFTTDLSADGTDLTLSYSFMNNTGADLAGVSFLSYLDADIGGGNGEVATTSGALATGQGFEVGDPSGPGFPSILDNLLLGTLSGSNALPAGSPGNVAMALSFALGDLSAGDSVIVDLLISEDGDGLGSFLITQTEVFEPSFTTAISYSGQIRAAVPVPLPGSLGLMALGLLVARFVPYRRIRRTRAA